MLDYSDREYNMISTIATREELKEAMHAHFVHFDYDQRVQQRLDHLRQGSRSPNEHYSEMRKLMHKIGMRYPDKIILSKFITSLNRDIGKQVEHKRYTNVLDALHHATMLYDNAQRRTAFGAPRRWSSLPLPTPFSGVDPSPPTRNQS